MILAKKVRLYPSESQEQKLWQSVGTARFIYNWTLAKQEENYKNGGKFLADTVLRKNKSYVVRKNEKSLKRLQRQVTRKYKQNKKGKEYVKTKNIIKLENRIRLVHRRLTNIRTNYLHQTTTSIVKTKPYRVVIEDLNIIGMMKNKHLSKVISK